MGKAARLEGQKQRAEARRHPEAAEVAGAARATVDAVLADFESFLAGHGTHLVGFDAADLAAIRESWRDAGWDWPSWCYLPGVALAATLADQAGTTRSGSPAGLLQAVMPLTAVAAWLPGRVAVRFDPDLLAEVTSTPLEGDLPVELLERLPIWGLYLDTPHLGDDVGVLACLEPSSLSGRGGRVLSDAGTGTELWLVFSLPEEGRRRLVAASVWIGAGSIDDALSAQGRARLDRGIRDGPEALEDAFRRPYAEVLRGVVSMLLYLCSAEPDLSRRKLGADRRPGAAIATSEVWLAGYRLGAALRRARRQHDRDPEADATGRSVTPHLRSAHFHSFWLGPKSDPEARRLELRWLPPIPVNLDRGEAGVVVRRVGR